MSLGIYKGEERLCFGLDIGTTMSAVSYVHLENGEEPRIRMVTRWPGLEEGQGDYKVPTVVRYDSQGHAVRFGADNGDSGEDLADTQLAKWFKLRLHPSSMREVNQIRPPPLPYHVDIKTVYTDFLRYIFGHTKSFLNRSGFDSHGNPLFDGLRDNFVMVLAIPNDCDYAQKAILRDAVVAAGILPADHDRYRLQFVSEAEASIHIAFHYARTSNWVREGAKIAVCNAGDYIAETTVYRCTSVVPTAKFEKMISSDYVKAGSVSVDEAVSLALGKKLASSQKYGSPDMIASMVRIFSKKTKRQFDATQERYHIQFGQPYDNDRPLVTTGRVILTCDELKSIFNTPVTAIATSIENIIERSGGFESLILMGRFAESKYLRAVLDERLTESSVRLIRIDEPLRKAAAEGCVAWFAKQCIPACASRPASVPLSQPSTMRPSTVHPQHTPPRLPGSINIFTNIDNDSTNAPHGVINTRNHVEIRIGTRDQLDDDLHTIENRLERSHHVSRAVHDAQPEDAGCMEGTRAQLLTSVKHLVTSRDGPHIIWIAGMAGSGKTSIALTLCRTLFEDSTVLLGGTFFCSRATSATHNQADAQCIIPTFATLLVRAVPACAATLAAELRRDPSLAEKSIRQQVQSLLVKPLNSLGSFERHFIFVIDALDQCSDRRRVLDLVNSLADFTSSLSVKFLVTSRPDSRIRESRVCTQNVGTFIELHKLDVEQVTADIRLFIQKTFETSAGTGNWYSEDDLDDLARLSNGLFQFAVIAVGWILKSERSWLDRLERVKTEISVSAHSPPILDQMRSLMKS